MSKYLDKFRSTMPAIQGKQILQLLNGMKDSGAITTVGEYNTRLQELSEHLRSTDPAPIFSFLRAKVGDVISSDMFNAMVSAAQFDLEAAFQEADQIATVLDLHKTLYKLTILKGLDKAIRDLEKTITLYEFFNRDQNGFSDAQYNTFDSVDGNAAKRTDAGASNLFYDTRKREDVGSEEDCQVDLLGQQLVLPQQTSEEIKVVNVTLVDDSDTTIPVRDTQYATIDLQNIRDQERHTFWIYPVLTSSEVSGGVKVKIKLDLGGIREFNTLQIEPACPFTMILESVSYISEDGKTVTIDFDATIDDDVSYNLGGIEVQFVTLTFKQESVESTIYHYDPKDNMWERVWDNSHDIEDADPDMVDRLGEELRTEVPDSYLREVLNIPTSDTSERVTAFQYTFGLDNVRIFINKYRPRGIFVGQKFTVEQPGLLGLKVSEENQTVQIGNTSYPQFSFEYSIVKYDYDANGSFISKEVIPVLPIGSGGTVQHERLHLIYQTTDSSVPNVAVLRFTPDITGGGNPTLTKNLTDTLVIGDGSSETHDFSVLIEGDDWDSDWTDSWSTIKTRIDSNSALYVPTNVYIKFHNPSIHAIYTVSYAASTRNTDAAGALPRKLLDYVTMQDNYVLRCSIDKKATVKKSDLYLVVMMRNNYLYQTSTPALQDYKLLVSSYDNSKFVE